jgi:hypothetical protein
MQHYAIAYLSQAIHSLAITSKYIQVNFIFLFLYIIIYILILVSKYFFILLRTGFIGITKLNKVYI